MGVSLRDHRDSLPVTFSQCFIRDGHWNVLRGDTHGYHCLQCTCWFPRVCHWLFGPTPCQDYDMITGFTQASALLGPRPWPMADIPARQMPCWILTVVCFQFMGDYWLRHIKPDYTDKSSPAVSTWESSPLSSLVSAQTSRQGV